MERVAELVWAIAERYGLRRAGGSDRWTGPCPKCGGKRRSDRFSIKDDGGFKCYACDFKGDMVSWLRKMDGMSCPEAHEAAGLECRALASCQADSCRFKTGGRRNGGRIRPRPVSVPKNVTNAATPARTLAVRAAREPGGKWVAVMERFVREAAGKLAGKKDVCAWLAKRGIDRGTAARFRLGWNPAGGKVARRDLGLGARDDGKEYVWLPAGLVIPIYGRSGRLHRVRVRRPAWERRRFLEDLKYVWIEGSGSAPMVIAPRSGEECRGVVVVESELDAIAVAAAHPAVAVVALGTVNSPVPQAVKGGLLDTAPVILVALDADGPGAEAVAAWRAAFRHAVYWPVPDAKDPGDYVRAGGDLGLWVEAGLPPVVAAPPPGPGPGRHDGVPSADGSSKGEEGGAPDKGCGASPDSQAGGHHVVELADGRRFHVLADMHGYEDLVAAGEVVFSAEEFEHVRRAATACGPEGGRALASTVMDVKAVFVGSWVAAGRVLDAHGGRRRG